MIAPLALAMLAAPGSAPARSPLAATVVAPKPPATATVVPTKPADPVADPRATVAQPAPSPAVPERPPGEGSPTTANPTSPAGAAAEPKPAPTPPVESRPARPPVTQTPAPSGPPTPALPETVAPGFSTNVVEAPRAQAKPEDEGSRPLWWLVLGGALIAAAGTAGAKIHRRRLVERTHDVLSIEPKLDTGRIPPSMPDLAFSAPPTSISTRLEAGAPRTWTA